MPLNPNPRFGGASEPNERKDRMMADSTRTLQEIDALYAEGWVWLTDAERGALLESTEGIVDGSKAIGFDQPWVADLKTARSKVIRSAPVSPPGAVHGP